MISKAFLSAIFAAGLLSLTGAFAQSEPEAALPMYKQSADPFSALVGKPRERREERAQRSTVERYVLASDNRAFLFENRSQRAHLKFLCGPDDPRVDCTIDPTGPAAEIYLVTPTRGPRGDVIYKNAEGDTLLRIASYGGATVFWPGSAQGFAASKSFGDSMPLRLNYADYAAAQRRASAASATISALTGSPIVFDLSTAPDISGVEHTVLADAVVRAAKGLQDVADDPTGARIIASKINRVTFMRTKAPSVALDGAVLTIGFVPDQDIEGRPSSSAVARFLEETL